MQLDHDWVETIEQNFRKGQCYVILCRDSRACLAAFYVIIDAMEDVTGYITTVKIRYLPSHAEIVFCPADDQQRLRGIPRGYILIDPNGLATPETLHRFR